MGKAKPTVMNFYIGKRIKELRRNEGLSQKELGLMLYPSVTYQQIQKYEKGKNIISINYIYQLANIFDVKIIDLLS